MSSFDKRHRGSVNGSGATSSVDGQPSTSVLVRADSPIYEQPAAPEREVLQHPVTAAERVFIASIAGTIAVGWVGLILAQLNLLKPESVLLILGFVFGAIVAATVRLVDPRSIIRSIRPFSNLRTMQAVRSPSWHDALLAGLLCAAVFLYTPPVDYTPAFLDAGWYTSAGALIARTGGLTARPTALEELPAADRRLFVRTYQDHRASMPRFPDRDDMGFYNLSYTLDLGRDSAVMPYHPPFTSVFNAILRLVGGREFGAYAAPLFGLLFVLAVYVAGRAIFGPSIALVGALLTALAPPTIYYARAPFAELLAGALIWGGVYALTRYATTDTSGFSSFGFAAPWLVLAGLTFGTVPLVKFEGLLLLPAIVLFWAIWLRQRWATTRELVIFLIPFVALSAHAALLYATTLRPYVALNAHGLGSILSSALRRPAMWLMLTMLYGGTIVILLIIRQHMRSETRKRRFIPDTKALFPNLRAVFASLQSAASLIILASAGIVLLFAWPASQTPPPAPWSSIITLGLFLTPLGLCLGIVGLSTLIANDLSRRTAFLIVLLGTAGITTVLIPAISRNVSYLYTVRRQVAIVMPALLMLTAYATLGWAGLADGGRRVIQPSAGLRRVLVILMLALLVFNFVDTSRAVLGDQELAGSSQFVADLAQSFGPDDIVLFESVDRGAHVGRFAAPLWAEHGLSAMLLSTTYPPQDQLVDVIRRWQDAGRDVYLVSQSEPPPFSLPNASWQLVDRRYWAGATIAAKMSFPPETWILEIPFYIYRSKTESVF